MEITAALAADLGLLSEALDDPVADLAATLKLLAADARLAVRSFLGLSVIIKPLENEQIVLTALEDLARYTEICASLRMPLPLEPADPPITDAIFLILFAARPGAFVDLAADLAWLTERDLGQFVLDADLSVHDEARPAGGLRRISMINQAIGVLIAEGRTVEQADDELARRATRGGVANHVAANTILSRVGTERPSQSAC